MHLKLLTIRLPFKNENKSHLHSVSYLLLIIRQVIYIEWVCEMRCWNCQGLRNQVIPWSWPFWWQGRKSVTKLDGRHLTGSKSKDWPILLTLRLVSTFWHIGPNNNSLSKMALNSNPLIYIRHMGLFFHLLWGKEMRAHEMNNER